MFTGHILRYVLVNIPRFVPALQFYICFGSRYRLFITITITINYNVQTDSGDHPSSYIARSGDKTAGG
jgi:hypothetical protein